MAYGFQSQTGFPGHLAMEFYYSLPEDDPVSIPDGLPRPFSRRRRGPQRAVIVRFQSQTGFPGHLAVVDTPSVIDIHQRFNPRRASQAI